MRSSYQSQKPEAALQRAHEFLSVGKEKDALQSLHTLIKDRRNKVWSQTYELIMLKYVELCVNLRNSALAKDGLYQYKTITQQVNVKSLETVLEKFLKLAEQKTVEAQKISIEKIEEIDDLDVADAPENLLLSFVSGAVAQDRMDRTVLSPWLRFLWDTYRNCLDLLRNNSYVELLYNQIARQTFGFCQKYQRRNEFRKLCDMLRLHLTQLQKAQLSTATHTIKLTNVESLSLMLETRLIQLDTAINMELWQEAYKSAEDLHNLMQIGKDKDKKIVKATNYVNYYDKIALVFWKGGNALFHAASLLQKFNIYRDMKKQFTDDEAMDQATRVLLATLSIPDGAENPSILTKHLDIEEQHVANTRVLSALLRLSITPTRAGILKEIARFGIPELVLSVVAELYKCIETDFNPLQIAPRVQNLLLEVNKLGNPAYSQYTDSIKQMVAAKVIKQVSMIYENLSISRFAKIIPFFGLIKLEQFTVDVCKQHSLKVHIDHRKKCIRFGPEDASLATVLESENSENSEMNSVKMQLALLYSRLESVYRKIEFRQINVIQKKLERQIEIYNVNKERDFQQILNRRKKIESYKENTEQIKQEKIMQAQEQANKREEKRRKEEYSKLQEENKENEKRRKLAEQEELKRKVRAEQLKKNRNHPLYEQLLKEYGEEALMNMDPDDLIKEKRMRLEAERREQQTKLIQQEKKYDYTVRAYHLEEMKIYKQMTEDFQRSAPDLHDEYETKRIANAIRDHEKSFETYENLKTAMDDAKQFMRDLIKSHADELATQKEQWRKSVDEARQKALRERALERREKHLKEIEEQKRIQEEQRFLEEEKQRLAEQKRQQEAARRAAAEKEQASARKEPAFESRNPPPQPTEQAPPPPQGDKKGKYVPPRLRNKQ